MYCLTRVAALYTKPSTITLKTRAPNAWHAVSWHLKQWKIGMCSWISDSFVS